MICDPQTMLPTYHANAKEDTGNTVYSMGNKLQLADTQVIIISYVITHDHELIGLNCELNKS